MIARPDNFEAFYQRQLEELKLIETPVDGKLFLLATHWFFNLIPRRRPALIGIILRKPIQKGQVVSGIFEVVTYPKGLVWKLSDTIQIEFGTQAVINPTLHARYL